MKLVDRLLVVSWPLQQTYLGLGRLNTTNNTRHGVTNMFSPPSEKCKDPCLGVSYKHDAKQPRHAIAMSGCELQTCSPTWSLATSLGQTCTPLTKKPLPSPSLKNHVASCKQCLLSCIECMWCAPPSSLNVQQKTACYPSALNRLPLCDEHSIFVVMHACIVCQLECSTIASKYAGKHTLNTFEKHQIGLKTQNTLTLAFLCFGDARQSKLHGSH